MKINLVLVLLATSLVCSTAAAAADGTINFTGNITTAACTVSTASASQTVNLGTVTASSFTGGAGVSAAPTRFTIALSACPDTLTSASIKFDGVADTTNSNLLALSSGQTAGGVGIGIYEANGSTIIPLQTASSTITFDATGNASIDYVAKYVSTAASVTAGTANSVTNFTIAYN